MYVYTYQLWCCLLRLFELGRIPSYPFEIKLLWIKVAHMVDRNLLSCHSSAEGRERERPIEADGARRKRRWKRRCVVITFRIDLNFPRFHIHQQVIRIVDEGDKFSLLMGLFPSWHECWGRMHLGGGGGKSGSVAEFIPRGIFYNGCMYFSTAFNEPLSLSG